MNVSIEGSFMSGHFPMCISVTALVLFIGCGEKQSPDTTAVESGEIITEQDAPEFDPRLTLEWPGTPEESRRRINAGMADETTTYRATFRQTGPVTIFEATVHQFSEKDLQGTAAKEMLVGHGTGSDVIELTRKQIEHGPNKYPGFDVTAKDDGSFDRRVNILAGRRLYSVRVVSVRQERLNAQDVTKFFESFAINE